MYKIIGADQKEYGPVNADQIRYWIGEGRLNAHSKIRAEGELEWKSLSEFPEFAEVLGIAPGAPPPLVEPSAAAAPSAISREAALLAVKGPAIGLIVIAALAIALELSNLVLMHANRDFLYRIIDQNPDPHLRNFLRKTLSTSAGAIGFFQIAWHAAVEFLILFGAIKMMSLRNYQLAFAVSILAMLPCVTSSCCCVLGLPFGIWALVVLNRPGVKSHFT